MCCLRFVIVALSLAGAATQGLRGRKMTSTACHTSVAGEDCYRHVQWAMEHGIHHRPQWYPGLSSNSTFADFQSFLNENGHHNCPKPCVPVPAPKPTPEPTTTSASTRTTTPAPTTTPGAKPQCEFTIGLYEAVKNPWDRQPSLGPMVTSYKLQYKKCTHLPGAKPGEPAYEVSEASFFPGQPEDYCLTYHMTVRACDDTSSSFTVFTDGMRSTCKNLLDGGEGYMCNGESARLV